MTATGQSGSIAAQYYSYNKVSVVVLLEWFFSHIRCFN